MKRICWLSLLALVTSCDRNNAEPQFAPVDESISKKTAELEKKDASVEDARSEEATDAGPNPEAWASFSREDDIPFCLLEKYADWGEVQYLKDAKPKANLKADAELHIGVYAPRCAHPDCTKRVNMQCWAEVEGETITLHSRYNGMHNPANTCTKDCEPDTAACNTPPLKAGNYTIQYGAFSKKLRIPSVVKPTCIDPLAK